MDPSVRCISCVLPRSTRGLRFDQDGRCELCGKAAAGPSGEAAGGGSATIEEVMDRIRHRGRGRPYDCTMGLSGGRDSTYMLYELVREHRLRVLAVYYRTPFTPDAIDANVRRVTEKLGVDLEPMRISQERHRKVARGFALAWKRSPIPEFANLVCAPCKMVNHEMFRIARRHRVPSVMVGGSQYEDFQFGAAQIIGRKDEDSAGTQALKLLKVVRKGMGLLLRHPEIIPQVPLAFRAAVLYMAPHSIYLRVRYKGIDRYNYFRLKHWDEAACNRILAEVGWELPPGCNSTWKADCDMAEAKNAMFRQMRGLSYVEALFSNMIRAGAMSRSEALGRLAQEGRMSEERLARLTDALGLPRDFFADEVTSDS